MALAIILDIRKYIRPLEDNDQNLMTISRHVGK